MMHNMEKIIQAWERCQKCEMSPLASEEGKSAYLNCEYTVGLYCARDKLINETITLLKEQKEERKRLLSWLSKFCRHIDNGDKWLTDEENLEFFRKKMEQQFGWDCD